MRYKLLFILFLLFASPLLISFLSWYFSEKKIINICIVDKTVLDNNCSEHKSLNWILNYYKISKPNYDLYNKEADYYGYFPLDSQQYYISDLNQFSRIQLDSIADTTSILYITDTYGIYYNEWYREYDQAEHSSKIYGGLDTADLYLLQQMKLKHKTIITEFNDFNSPTTEQNRNTFEKLFGLKWSKWIGRYFESLDTNVNKELPNWLVENYLKQHNNTWPFLKSGIGLVSDWGQIEILENKTHLTNEVPYIHTFYKYQKLYQLPDSIKYPFWFDISYTADTNEIISYFHLNTNKLGDSILATINLSNIFPATIEHLNDNYTFYYFAADYCDNPVNSFTSYFKGVPYIKHRLSNPKELSDRKTFFWEYYLPLMNKIFIQDAIPIN